MGENLKKKDFDRILLRSGQLIIKDSAGKNHILFLTMYTYIIWRNIELLIVFYKKKNGSPPFLHIRS